MRTVLSSSLAVVALALTVASATAQQRESAATMSYLGAPWLERVEREREERPDAVLDVMALERGDVVADVGVGSGYFARRIAKRVGDEGRVYGVDIQPEMLEILEDRARAEGIENIVSVLGETADPKLPAGQIDWILLADVYHEFSDPGSMLEKMRAALAPGGKVALLEYRSEDASGDRIYPDHRMSVRQVLAEWEGAGFELLDLHEFLPSQHLFVFRDDARPDANEVERPELEHYDLFAAVERGLVELEARGAGRETVDIRIRRTADRRFVVSAAAGAVFRAEGNHRNMVARSDAFRILDNDGWVRWDVRAVGTSWERPVPGGSDRFVVQPETVDERITGVARAFQAGTFRIDPSTEVVTYAPQTIGVAEASLWIAVADPSYEDVSSHLGDEQVPARFAAAFGLILCERAGIDVRATRIWRDAEAIFSSLPLREVQSWYAFRAR